MVVFHVGLGKSGEYDLMRSLEQLVRNSFRNERICFDESSLNEKLVRGGVGV